MRHPFVPAIAPFVLASFAAFPVCAQSTLEAPVGTRVAYAIDSGPLDNPSGAWAIVYSKSIVIPTSHWLRLHFKVATLNDGSYLLATSTKDGETHRLDAASLLEWSNSTAYLNGDTIDLQLIAPPHSKGHRLAWNEVEAELDAFDPQLPATPSTRGDSNQCGVCTTDDRTPSSETWSGRIMPVGCSGSIIHENSAMISAGHCVGSGQVIQFNVPSSNTSCGTTNPPVADQFPVTVLISANGGVGNDWAVYSVGTNSLGQRPFQRYGQLRRPALSTPANVGAAADIFGYGADLTCVRTYTQQRSVGTITNRASTYYLFNNDIRGGNSGSGFLTGSTIQGVVTHCTSCGGNVATRVDVPAFAAAIEAAIPTCPADIDDGTGAGNPDGGVDINDLLFFLRAFEAGSTDADLDNGTGTGTLDGGIDINDLLYFLSRFEAGC